MQRRRSLMMIVFGLISMAMTIAMVTSRGTGQDSSTQLQQSDDLNQVPIANYSSLEITDPVKRAKRQARNKKHDKSDWSVNPENPADSTVRVDFLDPKLPAFPIAQSNIVVIGEITDAQAYLSEDKTGVYTEFSVRINEVLKNDATGALAAGSLIDVEREGGRVRFPSGRVHWYGINGARTPHIGGRYILFLKSNNLEQFLTFSQDTSYVQAKYFH